jgi:hypothetical protein
MRVWYPPVKHLDIVSKHYSISFERWQVHISAAKTVKSGDQERAVLGKRNGMREDKGGGSVNEINW